MQLKGANQFITVVCEATDSCYKAFDTDTKAFRPVRPNFCIDSVHFLAD